MKKGRGAVIAGTHSGSGKTTVTLGLMAALQLAGYSVAPFKCGPDFIDPTLHKLVTGRVSRNLDVWMSGESFVRKIFARHADGDIAVIEGVMGMFDGAGSSSAALAKTLGAPLFLVLDVRSAAESVAAVLKGFETLDPEISLKGVILNRVASQRHLQLVSDAIRDHCDAEILGYLPRNIEFELPSRHLGLHMGDEVPISAETINSLAQTVKTHIDLDRLVELAEMDMEESPAPQPRGEARVRIGVARDKAFCFYYKENIELLQQAGAEVIEFSPLEDSYLPDSISGLYLGGGYPELYAGQLTENTSMLRDVKRWAETGGPIYAECGGFMYLTQGIFDLEENFFPMAGVFPTTCRMQKSRASLGYREVRLMRDSFFGKAGTLLRGHEFHYSSIDKMDGDVELLYAVNNGTFEGYTLGNVLGGYMHLHFGYYPGMAEHFVNFCEG